MKAAYNSLTKQTLVTILNQMIPKPTKEKPIIWQQGLYCFQNDGEFIYILTTCTGTKKSELWEKISIKEFNRLTKK